MNLSMRLIVSVHAPDISDPENPEGTVRDFVKKAIKAKDKVEFRKILREHVNSDVSEAEALAIHNRKMEFRAAEVVTPPIFEDRPRKRKLGRKDLGE